MRIAAMEERLNVLFDRTGLKDVEIARRLGVAKQTISCWRSGVRSPKRTALIKIADTFHVDVAWLLGYGDDASQRQRCRNMTLLDKLAGLMEEHRDTVASLSRKTGLPYTTIDGLFKKGFAGARIGTVQAIAKAYGVSLDYMIRDEITDPHFWQVDPAAAPDECRLLAAWRGADDVVKALALEMLINHQKHREAQP